MKIERFNTYNHLNEGAESSPSNLKPQIPIVIKGDKEANEMAKKMVGDGKDPNMFFVTVSNDFRFLNSNNENQVDYYSNAPKDSPIKAESKIEVETFGPINTWAEAFEKAEKIELSETVGPRMVQIEDRINELPIYERYLELKVVTSWQEEIQNDSERLGYTKKDK